jgi:hypothetical protein
MMDEAIRIKAEKKKEADEKLAKEKGLKAQQKQWTILYNITVVQLRKWGPEMLQEVEVYQPIEDRLSIASTALKTPKARKKGALPTSPTILYILPKFDFPDLPRPLAKARPTPLALPPSLMSSPTRKTRRRRQANKAIEVTQEVIEPLVIATRGGRRSKRRLFHNKVLVNTLAN